MTYLQSGYISVREVSQSEMAAERTMAKKVENLVSKKTSNLFLS